MPFFLPSILVKLGRTSPYVGITADSKQRQRDVLILAYYVACWKFVIALAAAPASKALTITRR